MTGAISIVIADKEVSNVKGVAIDTKVVSDTKVANEGQIGAFVCPIQGQVEKFTTRNMKILHPVE